MTDQGSGPLIPARPFRARALLLALAVLITGCFGKTEADRLASARRHIEKKDNFAAILEVKTLLEDHPGSGPGRLLFGKLLHDSGQMAWAETELRRALEAGQPESDVLPLMAAALLAQGKAQALLVQFGAVDLPDAQADAELKTLLAAAAAAGGDLTRATALLDQAEQRAVDRTVVEIQRARLTAASGDVPGALAQVQALTARQPNHPRALALLGDLLAAGGPDKLDAAIAAWRGSLAAKPDDVAVHALLIGALMQKQDWTGANQQWSVMKAAAPAHPQTLYLEAVLAEQRGDAKRTRELAQQLLKRAPESFQALMLAGRTALRHRELAQAERHFLKALQISPAALQPRQMLAHAYVQSGQADKAIDTLKPLIEGKSPEVETILIAAQAQLMRGDMATANRLYALAAQRDPSDPRARTAAAIVKVAKARKGQDAAALQELQDIAANDKGTAADLALINVRLQRGMLDDALKAIDGLAAKVPNDPQPDYMRARIALMRKDVEKARLHFDQALVRDADFMPGLMGLTSLDLLQGKPEDAKARLEKVVKRNGRHVGAILALADLTERAGGRDDETRRWLKAAIAAAPDDPIPRARLIDHLLRSNDLPAASEAAQVGAAALPADVGLLDRLGLVQMRQGELRQAMTTFQKMVSLQPQSPHGYVRLAGAQTVGRDYAAAAANLRLAAQRAPDDPGVQRALAELGRAEGKPAAALTAARRMQARDKAGGLTLEGDIQAQQGNWPAAVAAYRKALVLAPTTELALSLHAALLRSGQVDEARKAALEWRKSHPNDFAYIMTLARNEMAAGRFTEAERLYREVLASRPAHVMALNNLASLLLVQKKPGALAMAEQAARLAPDLAAVQDTLAACLAAEQRMAPAIAAQRRAVDLAPGAPQYALQLARLYLKAGEKDKAIPHLEKLEKLGSRFPRQADVQSLLAAARG